MKIDKKTLIAFGIGAFTLVAPVASQPTTADPPGPAATKEYAPQVGQAGKDVVWVPTPQTLVDRMLDMAKLRAGDRLVDLGSGDGRTVITAAKRGVVARGIEYNPDMVELARRAARTEGLADKVSFEEADIFQSNFSDATVVTLFLLPALNVKLRPVLLDMKPGTRILSNSFSMDEWQPDETTKVAESCANWCTAHKWIVPAKVGGNWRIGDKQLVLTQTYQMLQGTLNGSGEQNALTQGRLNGTQIEFTVNGERYTGRVKGDVMTGKINGKSAFTARRQAT